MAGWYLNPALTSWRRGVDERLPRRSRRSDGTIGDSAHQAGNSQHNSDRDGSVDAFDMDVNVLGSDKPTGTPDERRIVEALKRDFQADARSHLWIHDREIANEDIGSWRRRLYTGASPHDEHVHWESQESQERGGAPWRFTHTDRVLAELGLGGGNEGEMLVRKGDGPSEDVKYWQFVLQELGYGTVLGEIDGTYGPKMEAAVNRDRAARNSGPATAITGWHAFVMHKSLMQKHAGMPGRNGAPGRDGLPGKDGAPGKDGRDGRDGVDGVLTGTLRIDGGTLQATAVQE